MDIKEINYWLARYNEEEDSYNTGLEEEVGCGIRQRKKVTKEELKRIIEWKFQGRLKGRKIRTFNLIENIKDSEIQKTTEVAFGCDSDELRLKLLMSIKGIKIALSSVILTFFDPQKYCIFDIHVYDELFHASPKTRPKDLFVNTKYFTETLNRVRCLAKKSGLRARDVEKALFKKNFEQNKIYHN